MPVRTSSHFRILPRAGAILFAALAALTGPVGSATMYKWVDADGQVHYTQERPPPGVEGQVIKPPPPPASPEQAQEQLESRQELLDGRQEERQRQGREQAAAAEEKAWYEENCRRARQSVAAYQVPNALIAQPDGSRTRITEEERLAGLRDAEERVKEYCK